MPRDFVEEPPKAKRTERLPDTRVTEGELAAIKQKARESGLPTQSEYIRRACLDAVVVVREPLADVDLIRQLAAIGNNLNQLARSANIEGWLDPVQIAELEELKTIIRTLISELTDGPQYQ